MERIINIDGIARNFKASGATPRLYRGVTGRDLLVDFSKLENAKTDENGLLSREVYQIYEDLMYVMAKQGNDALPAGDERKIATFPATPDEWLDTIETLDIYDMLPQIAQMWRLSNLSLIASKKNNVRPLGN